MTELKQIQINLILGKISFDEAIEQYQSCLRQQIWDEIWRRLSSLNGPQKLE